MNSIKIVIFSIFFCLVRCTFDRTASISFEKEIVSFNIVKGNKFTTNFVFSNSGNGDLVIKSVDVSCGCVLANYPKYPISPGEKGIITVIYDSNLNGNEGMVSNDILVESNTNPILHKLSISGEVRGLISGK